MATKTEILEFSAMIEDLADTLNLTIMEAIVQHCANTGLEIEIAASMVSLPLKAKLKEEAQELNLLRKNSKLPL